VEELDEKARVCINGAQNVDSLRCGVIYDLGLAAKSPLTDVKHEFAGEIKSLVNDKLLFPFRL
jgi:hypothetical protein